MLGLRPGLPEAALGQGGQDFPVVVMDSKFQRLSY